MDYAGALNVFKSQKHWVAFKKQAQELHLSSRLVIAATFAQFL